MDLVTKLTKEGKIEILDVLEPSKCRLVFSETLITYDAPAQQAFNEITKKDLSVITSVRRSTFKYGIEDRHQVCHRSKVATSAIFI
jgi:hypothetical protein